MMRSITSIVVLSLEPANNTAGLVEYRQDVREVSAVSFGPDSVKFTATMTTGLRVYFTVSRIDASVSQTDSMFPDSVWNYKGCAIIEAPATRAF